MQVLSAAPDTFAAAERLVTVLGNRFIEARLYISMGNVYNRVALGNYTEALAYFQKASALVESFGDAATDGLVHWNMATAYDALGDEEAYMQCVAFAQARYSPGDDAEALRLLAKRRAAGNG